MDGTSLRQSLILARGACAASQCPYGRRYCPRYWRRVFILRYGGPPRDDSDRRWDDLFKEGYPQLRLLDEEESLTRAAS